MVEILMNGVEVNLKNPGTKGLKDFLIIQQAISTIPPLNFKGKSEEEKQELINKAGMEFLGHMNSNQLDSLTNLVNLSLKNTFEIVTPEIDQWAMTNSMDIMSEVLAMCSPKQKTDDENRKEKLIEKLNHDSSKSSV